jgi:hypothetical protein
MKIKLIFLLVFISFLAYSGSYSYKEIDFLYLDPNISILQGQELSTRVVLENSGNETIEWISIKFETPSGIGIVKPVKEVEIIGPKGRVSFKFNITASNDIEVGSKEISMWPESEGTTLNNRFTFYLDVKENPDLPTTTIATSTTTPTTIIPGKNGSKSSDNGGGISLEIKLIISILILSVLAAILVPAFKKTPKSSMEKSSKSFEKQNYKYENSKNFLSDFNGNQKGSNGETQEST